MKYYLIRRGYDEYVEIISGCGISYTRNEQQALCFDDSKIAYAYFNVCKAVNPDGNYMVLRVEKSTIYTLLDGDVSKW